jgi:hypothetical protein
MRHLNSPDEGGTGKSRRRLIAGVLFDSIHFATYLLFGQNQRHSSFP